jgi:hypothetical protein
MIMNQKCLRLCRITGSFLAIFFFTTIPFNATAIRAADYVPFDGNRSEWREGFERYDYEMEEKTLTIKPFKSPEGENFGVREPAQGTRRCIVVTPKQPAPGNPWSWRGCYWDHQPQTEVELLRRGFHIAYISANATLKPGKEWDAWYAFLVEKHGLSRKPAFIGMSRGGTYAYTWATVNPEKVSCIYADNPGATSESMAGLGGLASNDVPLLHVCGSIDPLLGKFSTAIENIYQQYGGRISVMIKDGAGHHPHSLRDPTPIANFIEESSRPTLKPAPDYLAGRTARNTFYSTQNSYREFQQEKTFITCRGPLFVERYDRFTFELNGVEGMVTVIAPEKIAAGKPWVFRSAFVARDASVDLALLSKGFHIVTGPVPYNADGPSLAHWNKVYQHLVEHGFSKKPVLEGAGRSAGDAYAWAVENADKVSCIYGENPVLQSFMATNSLLDNLAPLAKAGVPLLHACDKNDPWFSGQTKVVEQRYKQLGGEMLIIARESDNHSPLSSTELSRIADYIADKVKLN